MGMETIEEEDTQMVATEGEDTQEEEEDPWTTKDGKKISPQEEEEDKAGSREPGKITRTSNGQIDNLVVTQSPIPLVMTEIMR